MAASIKDLVAECTKGLAAGSTRGRAVDFMTVQEEVFIKDLEVVSMPGQGAVYTKDLVEVCTADLEVVSIAAREAACTKDLKSSAATVLRYQCSQRSWTDWVTEMRQPSFVPACAEAIAPA